MIAGIVSTTGAAREVLQLCEAGVVEPLVSRQVLTEADRNLSNKLPVLAQDYRSFIQRMSPTLVDEPSKKAVGGAAQVIHHKDAPILAAAISVGADYLITWTRKHFHKSSVMTTVCFKIMTPGEFLREFRRFLTLSSVG